jgi:hypothetical protein
MLKESRYDFKTIIALIALNAMYLLLVAIDAIEAVFGLWIIFIFLSLLPLIIKDKRNIILIIVFLIPLEITKTLIPFFQTVEVTEGVYNSVFDLARLFMLYSFIVWFIKDLKSFVPFAKNKISFILLIFIAYYLLSTIIISPDMNKGIVETIRYIIYFLFFTMIIQFIEKPDDVIQVLKVLVIVAVLLSIEGILEYVFDYQLWVYKGRRATATYLDPNIFARLLDIVICSLVVFRMKKIYIFKPIFMDIALFISVITLFLTVSRQGIFILFVTIFVIAFFLEKKQRNTILIAWFAIVLISIPVLQHLMSVREQGLELYDIGTRAGLILGGILMFIGSPLLGVGAGGFQAVMIANYLDLLPWGIHSATLSHTYIITILAEQGIVGIGIFTLFLWFVYKQFKYNVSSKDQNLKVSSIVIFAAMIIIFIGSQAEGRFYEEPLLWLFLGLHVALGRMIEKDNKKRISE